VLKLEPRPEPQEGLDARQLGNIYHHIFERLYESLPVDPPATLAQLLDALPKVASAVLDRAPGEEGFRATAWWEQTRQEIVDHVQRSLEKLHEPKVQGDYHPVGHEYGFFEEKRLVVGEGDEQFRLHGLIDRLDQAPDGRVRIIDYKTAGPSAYTNKALTEGEKIQLPLYALAARDALCLGDPADGFYWHVQHARRSPFTLRGYAEKCGRDPIEVALELARQAIAGVREGDFAPERPYKGCPSYCAAATFCPLYDPGYLP
jgi:ATP-dependent helicase/DNAse subunit B